MTTRWFMPRRAMLLLLVAAVLLPAAPITYAKERTGGGGDAPFYARIERGEYFHTDEWAVIIFYRPPVCVPDDFDLLDFFDFGAFACVPPTTDGFTIWDGEPWVSNPIQIELHGLGAVPVWFVAWPELEAAVADGVLTMAELEVMQSLVRGTADFYSETLHPYGGAQVPMINYVAHGLLEDGRVFHAHVTYITGGVANVLIDF